jgi:hypothetical protein
MQIVSNNRAAILVRIIFVILIKDGSSYLQSEKLSEIVLILMLRTFKIIDPLTEKSKLLSLI